MAGCTRPKAVTAQADSDIQARSVSFEDAHIASKFRFHPEIATGNGKIEPCTYKPEAQASESKSPAIIHSLALLRFGLVLVQLQNAQASESAALFIHLRFVLVLPKPAAKKK